jgi:hypothetical protein
LDQTVNIANVSLNTYTIDNLTQGAWFFAVVAVNASGIASDFSNIATKTVP